MFMRNKYVRKVVFQLVEEKMVYLINDIDTNKLNPYLKLDIRIKSR